MQANRPRPEPEALRELLPAIERGRPIAMLAASGSGHEAVFRAAIQSACSAGKGFQALILTPTRDAALRLAGAMAGDAQGPRMDLVVWPHAADRIEAGPQTEGTAIQVVLGPPGPLLREIRRGRLHMGGLKLLGIDGADQIVRLEEWPAARALLDTAGAEARKIVASASFDGELADLLEQQLGRARRWPEELFAREPAEGDGAEGVRPETLWYAAAERTEERLDLLAAGLAKAARTTATDDDEAELGVVVCPDEESARRVRYGLAARGIPAHAPGTGEEAAPGSALVALDTDVIVGTFAAAVRWSLPADLEAYTKGLPAAAVRMTVISALHLPQLELLARRAGWELQPIAAPPVEEGDSVERFRQAVRDRLREGDVSAELLLLEPLLQERPAVLVAGALAALLRERPAPEAGAAGALPEAAGAAAPRAARGAVLPAWTKIFLNVGKRDGAGPGDIVGAIAGESGAAGGQIGKVEIRSSFTLVDVDAEIADLVIQRLRGTQIKGRTVSARRAREAGG